MTKAKLTLGQAESIAMQAEALIVHDGRRDFRLTCERILAAGSIRRRCESVGDVELVAIPRIVEQAESPVGQASLPTIGANHGQGRPRHQHSAPRHQTENLLLKRLDELLEDGRIAKAFKTDGRPRWGEKYRAFTLPEHPDVHVELFLANARNWGVILAIRTGSADFSQELVTRIKQRGEYRVQKGHLTRVADGEIVDCPDEETMFKAAGYDRVLPPEERT